MGILVAAVSTVAVFGWLLVNALTALLLLHTGWRTVEATGVLSLAPVTPGSVCGGLCWGSVLLCCCEGPREQPAAWLMGSRVFTWAVPPSVVWWDKRVGLRQDREAEGSLGFLENSKDVCGSRLVPSGLNRLFPLTGTSRRVPQAGPKSSK